MLYIEDNPIHEENYNPVLNRLGLSWKIATTGSEGLRKVLSDHYTLLFLDIQWPEINGVEIAKLVRKKMGKDIFIIALSSYNQYEIESMKKE